MNVIRYFGGTRRKQWRVISVFLALVTTGIVYWYTHLLYPNPSQSWASGGVQLKEDAVDIEGRSFTKLEKHLFGVLTTQRQQHNSAANKYSTRKKASKTEVRKTFEVTTEKGETSHPTKTGITKPVKVPASKAVSSFAQKVSYNVHIFYYPWYGNPSHDGRYAHWNHRILPHWQSDITQKYPKGSHKPPEDIGADFYPELGCYSSSDQATIEEHFRQIRASGAGVVVVSWYPPNDADDQGIPSDTLIPKLLDVAQVFQLKVTLHIEPYKGRNERTVGEDVVYITKKYASHPAFYKYKTRNNKYLPLLYVYDSYHTKPEEWAKLLKLEGSHTIRNTPHDCLMIALMVESDHRQYIEVGGFDGFYTYFAVDGFTYGSRWKMWSNLKAFAKQTDSIFIPSVGPGYIDTSIRPWNSQNTRSRLNGEYYRSSFKSALSVNPPLISITSFNEWHEGTQIEKAVPKSRAGAKYLDYLPHSSDFYLKLTRESVEKFDASV